MLDSLTDELGRPPTNQEMDEAEGYPASATYSNRFGSWNEAKEEAGVDIDRSAPEEEFLNQLVELAEELGRSPTTQDIAERSEYPSPSTYKDRFDSWNEAKRKAGLETFSRGEGNHYSDEELIVSLLEASEEEGEPLTEEALAGLEGYPSPATYRYRFGSFPDAKEEAGIE